MNGRVRGLKELNTLTSVAGEIEVCEHCCRGIFLGTLLLVLVLFPLGLRASEFPVYQITENMRPIKLSLKQVPEHLQVASQEVLPVRVILKKFYVTKTSEGASVRFEKVCEENSSIKVEDMTDGGGLVQERLILACQAEVQGTSVAVVLSGMIYDTMYGHFSDEGRTRARNFFTHLQLQAQEGPILFGLGDFNLGYTRNFPFRHWVSELSTDAAGGRRTALVFNGRTREGFVAAVRYGKQ